MLRSISRYLLPTICLVSLLFFNQASLTRAEELTISGNGSNSSSSVQVEQTSTTNVVQNNDTQIDNNVQTESNTGDNQATGNTGGSAQINTGDSTTTTSVTNSANTSIVENPCCGANTPSATITGNGSGSNNSIDIKTESKSTIEIDQKAIIKNNVGIEAKTGNNGISDNNGDSSITTGDVRVTDTINNHDINSANVTSGGGNTSEGAVAKISGNGADSDNYINIKQKEECCNVDIDNFAYIENNDYIKASSGDNEIGDNVGSASITTGDVIITKLIENGPINSSEVICCPEVTPTPTPTPTVTPTVTPTPTPTTTPGPSVGNGGGGAGGVTAAGAPAAAGEILGAALAPGEVLPISGSQSLFELTMIGILLFIFGLYLQTNPISIQSGPVYSRYRR